MRKRKLLCPLLCIVFFFAGTPLEWKIQTSQRIDPDPEPALVRLAVVSEFKTCITDTEVALHRARALQNLAFAGVALDMAKLCEEFLDEYGPREPDPNKSHILGEMKLFAYGYKRHIEEMVAREVKIVAAETRLYHEPTSENMQILTDLEDEQQEGFEECFRFTNKLQRLATEAIER
jgi:hypothetical protein